MSQSRKEIFLEKKVITFDAKNVKNVDDILISLKNCGFQERNLGLASLESKHISVWCDATITLSILITGLLQRLKII